MQKFTQKWSLLFLLEPAREGYEFFWKDYPLHVTLASVFAIDWEAGNTMMKLKNLLTTLPAVETKATTEARWGDAGQYHVMLLEKKRRDYEAV